MEEQQRDPSLITERPQLSSVAGRYLDMEAAASWLAFGHFLGPGRYNWPTSLHTLFFQHGAALDERYNREAGRLSLAFDLIVAAVRNGLITAYGYLTIPETEVDTNQLPDDIFADGRTRKILPEEAKEVFNPRIEDFPIKVGDHMYDALVVEWDGLQKTFKSLTSQQLILGSGDNMSQHEPEMSLTDDQRLGSRGRPRKWDWDRINMEIILLAHKRNGLPETQAALETWVAEKCMELFGTEPGISTIRARLGPIYQRLRLKGQ